MNLFDWSFDKINTDSNNQKNGNILSDNQPAMEQFFFWCSFYLSCKTFFSMCETLKNNVFTGDFVISYLSSQLKKNEFLTVEIYLFSPKNAVFTGEVFLFIFIASSRVRKHQ